MERETYQKELFEFNKPRKSKFFRFRDILPKVHLDNRLSIALTLERVIFISIGITLLMVVIYALGVEKGKTLQMSAALPQVRDLKKAPVAQKETENPVSRPAIAKLESKEKTALTPVALDTPQGTDMGAKEVVQKGPVREKAGTFTIVAATFIQKDKALQEVDRLKRRAFDAFLRQSDAYFQVCIGVYPDKESGPSRRALSKVRQIYKDAYFRLK
ncbi:MAG: hypothetical protein A2987_04670 [Omnitrophica bacterium RIFCSPLOWO2_01_FULL_45_10]|nr:MAG: hypothetical protein A2987_04670 [Omnitrophica bacterium RIFCSPLOWO2_01_FULL_45_10]